MTGVQTCALPIYVDHRLHDGLNNQKYNLRICTHRQNMANSRANKNTSSRFKGVTWDKTRDRWKAQICKDKINRCIGYFHEEVAAAQAYNFMAHELFGEFAYYNDVGKLVMQVQSQ